VDFTPSAPSLEETEEFGRKVTKTTKLILLDSLLQEVEATLPHLVLQKRKGK
jgi:hypothetical protein